MVENVMGDNMIMTYRHRAYRCLQAHVGTRGYPNNLYAFELKKQMPKFAMFLQVSSDPRVSAGRDGSKVICGWAYS